MLMIIFYNFVQPWKIISHVKLLFLEFFSNATYYNTQIYLDFHLSITLRVRNFQPYYEPCITLRVRNISNVYKSITITLSLSITLRDGILEISQEPQDR